MDPQNEKIHSEFERSEAWDESQLILQQSTNLRLEAIPRHVKDDFFLLGYVALA